MAVKETQKNKGPFVNDREIEALKKLDHPNIVKFIESEDKTDFWYG